MNQNGKNRAVALLRRQNYSRVALARELGVGKSALTKVTKALQEDGLIDEYSQAETNADGKMGRPESFLFLKSHCYYSVCINVSTEGIVAQLIDLSGITHQRYKEPWSTGVEEKAVFYSTLLVAILCNVTHRLCSKQNIQVSELKSVCIATQGKIAQNTGVIHHSQLLKEHDVNFSALMNEKLGVPVSLYNIAYCSSFHLARQGTGDDSFVAILMGYGLGVGVSVQGSVFLGPDGIPPEISHLTYDRNGRNCYCGSKGCAERYLSYNAIFEDYKNETGEELSGNSPVEKLKSLGVLLAEDDRVAHSIIRTTGHVLGFLIAQLVNLFDIRKIYLNGETAALHVHLTQYVEEYFKINNNYQLNNPGVDITYEADDFVSNKGLLELTNCSYQL